MRVNGNIYNAEVSDVIKLLREQLAENNKLLFTKTMDSGDDLMVQCPYHKNGQERNPSAGIRKSDGMLHCFACGETHTLPEVIGYCFNSNAIFGQRWLDKNFGKLTEHTRGAIDLGFDTPDKSTVSYVSEEELDSYRYTHPYMYERGLTDAIIEKFDIGYDKKTDSITFPVRDITGRTLFVMKRNVKYKHFNIPRDNDKPLYGFYEVMECANLNIKDLATPYLKEVYLCEGAFDCLRLWCNGKCAVAGFGCLYSKEQYRELEYLPTRHLVLALDNDMAGQIAAEKLKKKITGKIITSVVLPKGRKDIGECTDEEILNLKETVL